MVTIGHEQENLIYVVMTKLEKVVLIVGGCPNCWSQVSHWMCRCVCSSIFQRMTTWFDWECWSYGKFLCKRCLYETLVLMLSFMTCLLSRSCFSRLWFTSRFSHNPPLSKPRMFQAPIENRKPGPHVQFCDFMVMCMCFFKVCSFSSNVKFLANLLSVTCSFLFSV